MKTIQHRKITVRTRTVKISGNGVKNVNDVEMVCPLCHRPHYSNPEALIDVPRKALPAVEECETKLTTDESSDR